MHAPRPVGNGFGAASWLGGENPRKKRAPSAGKWVQSGFTCSSLATLIADQRSRRWSAGYWPPGALADRAVVCPRRPPSKPVAAREADEEQADGYDVDRQGRDRGEPSRAGGATGKALFFG